MNVEAGRRFVLCDVFTDRAFGGNPLAVLPEADGLDGAAMARIAREFNLSETAFVERPERAGDTARVRIFTPAVELPFAGHPNIGTAFVLARLGLAAGDTFRFAERAGPVTVTVIRNADGVATGASVAAPVPLAVTPAPNRALLAAAVGLAADDLLQVPHAPAVASVGTAITVVVVSPDALARARPDPAGFDRLGGGDGFGSVYLHAMGADGAHEARLFAPGLGIPEDPATGSAAAALVALLLRHAPAADRLLITIAQGGRIDRPSVLEAEAWRAPDGVRSRVAGRCVLIGEGQLVAVP